MPTLVLVADHDQTSLELMTAVLTRDGFRVMGAKDATELQALASKEPPALILCSEDLPGATLVELCQELKSEQATKVVVLAGDANTSLDAFGCAAILGRPFHYGTLREHLLDWGLLQDGEDTTPGFSFSVPVPEPVPFDADSLAPAPLAPGSAPTLMTTAAQALMAVAPIPLPNVGDAPAPVLMPVAKPMVEPAKAVVVTESFLPQDLLDEPTLADGAPTPAQEPKPVPETEPALELNLDELEQSQPAAEIELSPDMVIAASPAPQSAESPADGGAELSLDELVSGTLEPQPANAVATAPDIGLDLPGDLGAPVLAQAPPPAVTNAAPPPVAAQAVVAAAPPPAVLRAAPPPAAATAPPPAAPRTGSAPPPAAVGSAPPPAAAGAQSLPASLPRYGDLVAMPLPRLVFELYLATFSGVLLVARHGQKRTLYFWGGLPARIDADDAKETLVSVFLSHGRLTPEQAQQAKAKAVQGKISEADALLELDLVKKSELLDAHKSLTEDILVETFGWRDGTYRLDPNNRFGDTSLLAEVHPIKAIFRGVREHYDLTSLLTFFQGLRERYAVSTQLFKVHFEALGPFLRNLELVSLLDGKTTFEEILRSDDRRAMEVAQALYVLLVTDMVRPREAPGEAAKVVPVMAAPPRAVAPADYREITRACDAIAKEYLRIKDCDAQEALQPKDSTAEATEQAYAAKLAPFLPERLPAGLPDDMTRRAREIRDLLGRAKALLLQAS